MNFHIITIFPEIFEKYFEVGVMGRAVKEGRIKLKFYNLRDYSKDKHHKVDDTPYGGGPGMVISVEPIYYCLEDIKNKIKSEEENFSEKNIKTVLLSAKGVQFNQKKAVQYSSEVDHLILICGRYEGVDERVAENLIDEEISIGEYILSGGEIPAMAVIDSVARLIPGVLGNKESLQQESFNLNLDKGKFDFPVYTKPEKFNNWRVPKVLLSGNHGEIEKWRKSKSHQLLVIGK
jgi:tRNA (guanine37-N1)-methyltransferase